MTDMAVNVLIPFVPGLTYRLKRILSKHNIGTYITPARKIGDILMTHKDTISPNKKQGAIYEIPCGGCNRTYIGETKRSFETRRKEHIRDVFHGDMKRLPWQTTHLKLNMTLTGKMGKF